MDFNPDRRVRMAVQAFVVEVDSISEWQDCAVTVGGLVPVLDPHT
jgi:hypothetical protein